MIKWTMQLAYECFIVHMQLQVVDFMRAADLMHVIADLYAQTVFVAYHDMHADLRCVKTNPSSTQGLCFRVANAWCMTSAGVRGTGRCVTQRKQGALSSSVGPRSSLHACMCMQVIR